MSQRTTIFGLVAGVLVLAPTRDTIAQQPAQPRVLVFSKTAGYRHSSIEPGVAALQKLGRELRVVVDATEDAGAFTERSLRRYRAVVFLSTTGDVLDTSQQEALERFIQAGGGWVGIHAATDTEYEWPWYGKLAGAYFNGHPNNPNVRKGTFRVVDKSHASTVGLPERWEREDEFYNFRAINPAIRVLVDIDEKSYEGGANGDRHPMSWYHEYDGGRAWYTNMGHTDATFSEPLFLRHLAGGIRYALGTRALDWRRARPEENRFTKHVLGEKLNEPMELAVLPDERVLFIERRGAVKLFTPSNGRITEIGRIPVSLRYNNGNQAEDGLLGLTIDPGFATNGWVYMFYSPIDGAKNVLARFTMRGDSIDLSRGKVMLEVMVQRDECCHTGGSMAFDAQGNLYLSTGDNTNPFASGYAPIDERPGREPWDAQKSSANTNDLRGKILRIHPEPDGTYTIPEGNLFPPGTPKTRPEIYTMGHRNPYRISVDRRAGTLYWGDVGPDAQVDSVDRGPAGHDEIGRAPRAGNYGWPYFVGDNKPYHDINHLTMWAGPKFDPDRPVNQSPNNTGMTELPPAQKAFIWYPYGPSAEFPMVGDGGRTAMAGPVFHRQDFRGAPRPFPQWYDGKLLIHEWMRGWINAVTMDSSGSYVSMERFMPSSKFANPVDMQFGPNGDLYLLEYGTTWFEGNVDARLSRIEFTAGNRAPAVVASVDRQAGALPHTVKLSSAGTKDLDDDSLRYTWSVARPDGRVLQRVTTPNATVTLARAGIYTATLSVADGKGARSTGRVLVSAGNDPPDVGIELEGNRTFYWPGVKVRYTVRVSDREDGTLAGGGIPAAQVRVSAEYTPDAPVWSDSGRGASVALSPHAEGKALVEGGTCLSCHQIDRKSIGPTYTAVAERYRGDTSAARRLVRKIRGGGSGVWGQVVMPAHPQLSEAQVGRVVAYILSLGARSDIVSSLPIAGEYVAADTAARSPTGAVLIKAAYTDRGANGLLGIAAETTVVLRSPTVVVASGELSEGVERETIDEEPFEVAMVNTSGAFSKLKAIDLTGIAAIALGVSARARVRALGGTIELRIDSARGTLIGETDIIPPSVDSTPRLIRVTLQPADGIHDVYVVFKNDQATGDPRLLFTVSTATFEHGGRPPSGR